MRAIIAQDERERTGDGFQTDPLPTDGSETLPEPPHMV
jgi:hypothetical protein